MKSPIGLPFRKEGFSGIDWHFFFVAFFPQLLGMTFYLERDINDEAFDLPYCR